MHSSGGKRYLRLSRGRIRHMEEKKTTLKAHYIPLLLFFTAVFFRLSIAGFNPSYPGNLKGVDSFLHSIHTDWVAETHQILKAPPYLSYGYEDVVFFHPPLLYPIPAAMTLWTGFGSHNTVWLFAVLISSFPILIFYLFGERIFNSKRVGILAGALYVLPATNLSFPD